MKKISVVLLCIAVLASIVFASLVDAQTLVQTQGIVVDSSASRVGCFKFTQNLRFGDGYFNGKSDAVLELQNSLANAGYLAVAPTGYFGPLTYRAVVAYQRNTNVSPTGFVGPITRGVLRSQFCTTQPPAVICDYAAPPVGCAYVPGPSYNSQTQCGMVLSCNQNPPVASDSCKVWYDGCNTCTRSTPGGPMACTLMYCVWANSQAATCKESFQLIQACPSEKIIDRMPVMCITTPCNPVDRSYYIYQGAHREISEFDNTWVAQHCSVPENIVY